MIRKPYGFLNANQLRRPTFPVPEDIFVADDQVAERHEQEIRSPAIDRAIDDWNVAKEQGDESGLRAAAKSIVDATTATFRLQGVPTFAHPVLPPQFVKAEAASLAALSSHRRSDALNSLLNLFDPSAKPGGGKQFAAHLEAARGTESPGEHGKSRVADMRFVAPLAQPLQREAENGLLTPRAGGSRSIHEMTQQPKLQDSVDELLVDRSGDGGERHPRAGDDRYASSLRTMEYRPDRDGPGVSRNLPWDGRRPELQQLQGMPLPPNATGQGQGHDFQDEYEAPWIPMPTIPGSGVGGPVVRRQVAPFPRPKPVTVPGARPGFQPNDWYSDAGARTSAKKVLISPSETSPAQQQNLNRRRWLHPTGIGHQNRGLKQGLGYFGASRASTDPKTKTTKVTSHGGLDCPGNSVRMPTDAELIGVQESFGWVKDSNGQQVWASLGYTLTFDLGDGLQLSLLHVKPSRRVLDLKDQFANPNRRFVRSARFRMGEDLGEVDHQAYLGKNDHTHLQITAEGGDYNGQQVGGFAIDPTYLFERDGVPIPPRGDAYEDDSGFWEDLRRLLPRF